MTQANKPSLPTKKKKGRLKEYRWPIAGVLFLLLLLAAFVIRLPYYIEMPGTASQYNRDRKSTRLNSSHL